MANSQLPPAGEPRPVIPVSRPAMVGATVTVACKLPHGLKLRIFAWEKYDELMRDGTVREGKRSRPIPDMEFVVRGTWVASAGQAYNQNNAITRELLPGGYAITYGCPKDLWDLWYEQNKESNLVRNHIVFASVGSPNDEAHEHSGVLSGMEPVNKDAPGERMPGGVDRRLKIGVLETGDNTRG